jgi:hypothetical protein
VRCLVPELPSHPGEGTFVLVGKGTSERAITPHTPQLSMEFKDRHDGHYYFNFYAFLVRFEVVIAHVARTTTSKKRNHEIFKATMKCNCQGKEQVAKSLEKKEA